MPQAIVRYMLKSMGSNVQAGQMERVIRIPWWVIEDGRFYSGGTWLTSRMCRTQMHFTLCVKGDVIVFALDPKPGVFAADNLPRPADNTNNVLLLGFR